MPIAYDDDDAGMDTGYSEEEERALLGEDAGVKPGSLLASVARKASEFSAKPTRIEVPAVAGLFAEYSTTLESRQLNRLQITANKYPDRSVRQFRFNLLLLAHYNIGLYINGEQVEDGNGHPATFRSRELWEQFEDVNDSASAVYAMFGHNDFAVVQAANALMTDAGLDNELTRQDPS